MISNYPSVSGIPFTKWLIAKDQLSECEFEAAERLGRRNSLSPPRLIGRMSGIFYFQVR
jgi:hypothetical protein